MTNGEAVVICVVEESVTVEAIKMITSINERIRPRACGTPTQTAIQFVTADPINEDERDAWEKIIRGVVAVF